MNTLNKQFFGLLFCAFCCVVFSGCATSSARKAGVSQSFAFEEVEKGKSYDLNRVARDRTRLLALLDELSSINGEAARLVRVLRTNGRPYFTQDENEEVAFLIFRFRNASVALSEISDFYFNHRGATSAAHTRGMVLALNATFGWSYYRARLVSLVMGHKKLMALGNSAYPHYAIPAGTYNDAFLAVTSIDELRRLKVSWELFSRELTLADSALSRLRETDEAYADLINGLDSLHADAVVHIHYVLHESRHSLMNVHNYLRHSRIADMSRSIGGSFKQDMYAAQGSLFKNVARIKRPATRLTEFAEEDLRKIRALLQPGDIILTFTAGYMSNIFLPGSFKHGITYVGTPEQRRKAGITDARLSACAISPEQLKTLRAHVACDRTASGHEADVIEAVAEGVVLNSLEDIMVTHVNRMIILRPMIDAEARAEQLTSLFCYLGMPYDFNFDFSDNSYQCCTELVYRTLNGKGRIDLGFERVRGKWVLTADDIANYYLENGSGAFELVLFVDSSKKDPKATLIVGDDARVALQELMQKAAPQVVSALVELDEQAEESSKKKKKRVEPLWD
ncbi:MAG: hypothetical protein ISS35_06715 [Kiritimatiellae bacterium]|nr:hypothetical protein [Kiritimatiellia bacterium]